MQHIKVKAYDFLQAHKIATLRWGEKNIFEEVLDRENTTLISYKEANAFVAGIEDERLKKQVIRLMDDRKMFSVVGDTGMIILFRDGLSEEEKIRDVFHEFGHQKSKHQKNGIYGESNDPYEKKRFEDEADAFSYYVLAPPCILNRFSGLTDAYLATLSGMRKSDARRALELASEDDDNILTKQERDLIHQYRLFISDNRGKTLDEDEAKAAEREEKERQERIKKALKILGNGPKMDDEPKPKPEPIPDPIPVAITPPDVRKQRFIMQMSSIACVAVLAVCLTIFGISCSNKDTALLAPSASPTPTSTAEATTAPQPEITDEPQVVSGNANTQSGASSGNSAPSVQQPAAKAAEPTQAPQQAQPAQPKTEAPAAKAPQIGQVCRVKSKTSVYHTARHSCQYVRDKSDANLIFMSRSDANASGLRICSWCNNHPDAN